MAQRSYLCGTSRDIFTPPNNASAKGENGIALRLRTVLHFPSREKAIQGFRVVARLRGGRCSLLCVGSTRAEVVARARALARELPAGTVALELQRWSGGMGLGRWQSLRHHHTELDLLRSRR
jgi:hypothetical protein